MFKTIFSAIGRVTASLNRTADLIDEANAEFGRQCAVPAAPVEGAPVPESHRLDRPGKNGRKPKPSPAELVEAVEGWSFDRKVPA